MFLFAAFGKFGGLAPYRLSFFAATGPPLKSDGLFCELYLDSFGVFMSADYFFSSWSELSLLLADYFSVFSAGTLPCVAL